MSKQQRGNKVQLPAVDGHTVDAEEQQEVACRYLHQEPDTALSLIELGNMPVHVLVLPAFSL